MTQKATTALGEALGKAGVVDAIAATAAAVTSAPAPTMPTNDDIKAAILGATAGPIPGQDSGETDADPLTLDQIFTRVIFTPVARQTYDRTNRQNVVTGFSRKVADVRIELGGSGIYTPATISLTQNIGQKNAHLTMAFLWNNDTKKSAFEPDGAAPKDALETWKLSVIERFKAYVEASGINMSEPATENAKTVMEGVSLTK